MLLYEKVVNGVRHIFGTQGNIPSDNDVQITYKKDDGTPVTLTNVSPLKDDGKGGMMLNGERVVAWMGNVSVIPKGVTPPVAAAPKKAEEPKKAAFAPKTEEVKKVEEPKVEVKEEEVKKDEKNA